MNNKGEHLRIGDEIIQSVALFYECRIIDKTSNKELFFLCKDDEEPYEQKLDGHALNEYFKCEYDRRRGYDICRSSLEFSPYYRIERRLTLPLYKYVIRRDSKVLAGYPVAEPVEISLKQFLDYLRDYPEYFDNANNKPTSCDSIGFDVVGSEAD